MRGLAQRSRQSIDELVWTDWLPHQLVWRQFIILDFAAGKAEDPSATAQDPHEPEAVVILGGQVQDHRSRPVNEGVAKRRYFVANHEPGHPSAPHGVNNQFGQLPIGCDQEDLRPRFWE
jgi:hypothetical protein